MRKVLHIALLDLRRLLRDRSNIFFVFIFPLLLVLLIGMQFGGSFEPRLVLHVPAGAGALADDLVARIEATDVFVLDRLDDPGDVTAAVERGAADVGLVLPDGYDAALRRGADAVEIGYVARQDSDAFTLQTAVESAVAGQAALVRAARFAGDEAGMDFDRALTAAAAADDGLPELTVGVTRAGESTFDEFENLGQFDLGATSQLLLFVFLTSLTGSAVLIQTRQLGLTTRMLSTPTRPAQVLVGQALGRFAVALTQAVYIVVGTALLFDVGWGDPLAAAAVIVLFCVVSAGAGMLLGAVFRNDAQAGGVGVLVGLGLAAIGGGMAPLEVFSPTMRQIAHITPHAWAADAFADLLRREGTLPDILPELAVLAAMAVALLTVATWRLQRVTVRP